MTEEQAHDYYIDLPAWGEREPFQDPRESEEYWETMGYFDREDRYGEDDSRED